MTALYIILILLQFGVIVFFVRRGRKLKQESKNEQSADKPASSYEGLRDTALQITPAQLNLKIPDNETLVYGVVMDCNVGNAIVTLSAYITGAVSMYFSTGGGKKGGGMYPQIAEAAVDFVTTGQDYIDRTIRVTTTELPVDGCVRFYLLTNKGIYVAQERMAYFENSTSAWLPLFEKGNDVIGQMHNSGNGNIV